VEQFMTCLVTAAGSDAPSAAVVRRALAMESAEGPAGVLARRLPAVLADAAHLL
jgi:hypothetical protein